MSLVLSKQTTYAPYAGIGSRDTPESICEIMSQFAMVADSLGYTVRSGGAEGADEAFEVAKKPELFLPRPNFNGKKGLCLNASNKQKAIAVAKKYHPAWHNCSPGAKEMHARNGCQVLGFNFNSPSKFIICWTKKGKMVGGTSQALRIALDYNIPIYNLAISSEYENVVEIITQHKVS